MMEIWKDIKGYEGLYQVSNLGRVKSLDYNRMGVERLLVCRKNMMGYLQVVLCKDSKHKHHQVHRLVAQAFIPNPYGLPQVNHKDECKTNNVETNLEWCNAKYNCNFGTRNERRAKAQSKAVYQYAKDGSLVKSYSSAREAERRTGYDNGNIVKCCNGKYKQAYGYLLSYEPINKAYNLF